MGVEVNKRMISMYYQTIPSKALDLSYFFSSSDRFTLVQSHSLTWS